MLSDVRSFLASLTPPHSLKLPPVTKELAITVFPLAFFWWLYAVTGLVALRYLTIPMFSTLRKFTSLVVLVGETLILRKRSPPSVWLSVLLIVAGGCLAGATDRSASAIGYLLVGICCVATAAYLVLIVRVGASSGLDSVGMLYYNNLLSLPLVLSFLAVGTSELRFVRSFPSLSSPTFWGVFGASSALATVLNFSVFFCTNVNSPLATTVTGQVKDMVTISVGSFAFGDVTLTPPNVAGLLLSILGSALFCGVKHVISLRTRRLAAAEAKVVAMESVGADAAPTTLTIASRSTDTPLLHCTVSSVTRVRGPRPKWTTRRSSLVLLPPAPPTRRINVRFAPPSALVAVR